MTRREASDCGRAWQVEALLDGRLADNDAASARRHIDQCHACAAELEEHEAIAERLRAIPTAAVTELDRKRARGELLRRANEGLLRPSSRSRRWLLLLPVAAVVAWILVRTIANDHPSAPLASAAPPAAAAPAPPVYDVEDRGGAQWHATSTGAAVRVELSGGAAAFSVRHLTGEQSFVVALPDGDIEVRGTRFVVEVAGGATRRIDVTDGRVSFRLRSAEPTPIAAGQSWTAETPAVPPPVSVAALSSARAAAPPARAPSEASALFEAAVNDVKSERYAAADDRLRAFLRDYPADARCEDAAFLRALVHSRMGDSPGASSLAIDYLMRYPNGLRRAEAERFRTRP